MGDGSWAFYCWVRDNRPDLYPRMREALAEHARCYPNAKYLDLLREYAGEDIYIAWKTIRKITQ